MVVKNIRYCIEVDFLRNLKSGVSQCSILFLIIDDVLLEDMGGSNPLMLLSELKEGVKPIDRLVFLNSIVPSMGASNSLDALTALGLPLLSVWNLEMQLF